MISFWDYPARADDLGTGPAIAMTVLDNIPIVDIALAGTEVIDAVQQEIEDAEHESKREERRLLRQLLKEAKANAPADEKPDNRECETCPGP